MEREARAIACVSRHFAVRIRECKVRHPHDRKTGNASSVRVRVFGAEEIHRMFEPGSDKLMHGELALDGHKFLVCDEFPPARVEPARHQKRSEEPVRALLFCLTMRT